MYYSLKQDIEEMPNWLRDYKLGDKINLREVLSNRVLFYPGAGTDGQPIKAFNTTHTLHTYLYSDYWMSLDGARRIYENDKVKGYVPYDIIMFPIEELMPATISADLCVDHKWNKEYPDKFCTMCIYERISEYDDNHGAERFALIYTNEDAYRVFNITFHPRNRIPAPYAIVLQEHGFGGNYDKWGRDGLLEKIAIKYSIYPKYYIIGMNNTTPWSYSYPCHDGRMIGGCARWPRELFKHKKESESRLWFE